MTTFPAIILVSFPKQTGLWDFLGCSFGSGPGLSLPVSTFTFHIQKLSLLFPILSYLCTITVLLCLSVTFGELSGPCSDLKAESWQGIYEDFPFFFLSSGTCFVASMLFPLDYGAARATQSCCEAL